MKTRNKARFCAVSAMCAALIIVCAWISIPTSPPFTLQSFAVLSVTGIFGASVGITSYLLYFLIGALGLPVFSGFLGGIGVLAGPTGGYLVGFGISILAIGSIRKAVGRGAFGLTAAFLAGNLILYVFASLFYAAVWLGELNLQSMVSAFAVCTVPFIPFDAAKLCLAVFVTMRLEGRIKI